MELPPGSKVDRYEIVSLLSVGPQFISYGARDPQLGRDVVLKEYFPAELARRGPGAAVGPRSPDVAQDFADGLGRFVADGHALENPTDASKAERVLALLEANGTTYIVSERVSETLERRVRPPAPVEVEAAPSRPRRSRALAIAAAAAGVLVIGTLVLVMLRHTDPAAGPYDGRYIGVVQFGTLRKAELSLSGASGKGSSENPGCGPIQMAVDVNDQGRVAGLYEGYVADCSRRTYDLAGQVTDSRIDIVVTCKTCMGTGTGSGSLFRLAAVPRAYDGSWSVVHVCPPAGAAQGFTNRYTMTVKEGWATAQLNVVGQPDSLTLAGQIRPDGAVAFAGVGRLGPAAYNPDGEAEGTRFALSAAGRFSGSEGTATVAGRDCTLTFLRTGA